jgi:hypothetical protein
MQITDFERQDRFYSLGSAAGEGLHYRFVADNATAEIVRLEQEIDGGWVVGPDRPMFLRTLVAAKCADEAWRHGEGPVFTLQVAP